MHLPHFGGDAQQILDAVGRQLLIVELTTDGKFLFVNDHYCEFVGHDRLSLIGKPHSVVVDADYANSPAYKAFLAKIADGESFLQQSQRKDKNGRQVWVHASYDAVRDTRGRVRKVVGVGFNINELKLAAAEDAAKLEAISWAQLTLEFSTDGRILAANENFLDLMGYRLDEIRGQHQSMFVGPADARSAEYQESWERLRRGESVAGEFNRFGKNGKEVWLEASYCPVFDLDHHVIKIVEFANDATGRINATAKIGAGLARLAGGDLKQRIDTPLAPQFEKLRVDFNASAESLERLAMAIVASAEAVRSNSGDITCASDDLSQRTEQQASSLEETAAALEEITTTVKKTAEAAKHAHAIVGNAKIDAEKSGAVVREAMAAMTGIDHSSKQISDIIGVIDEIAFQTNLLALNAGVEAARAGEAGRGFAVVASEVRALAQRSAEAAKEIKGLISTSTTQVDRGVKLVTQTGQALERIVAQVVETNDVIANIAASANEQAGGMQQINTAIANLDQVTQKNAEVAEKATAASHKLSQEADELAQLMTRFDISRPEEDSLRRELAKAAPHAFAKPTAPPPRAPAKAAQAPVESRAPARRAKGGGRDDWSEF